jgi:F-type H+-transporting ATPase subunit c
MKLVKSAGLALLLLILAQAPAHAQDRTGPAPFSNTQALAVGVVIVGAALGIGGLAKASVESMARQPEIEDKVRTVAIILAALIEGVTLLALIIIGFVLRA